MPKTWTVATLAAVLVACAAPAQTQQARDGDCFYANNITGWSALDADTVAITVGGDRRYALELISDARELRFDRGIALQSDRNFVCTGANPTGVEVHSLDPNLSRSWVVIAVTRLGDEASLGTQ